MTLAAETTIDVTTVSDLLHELGDIPPSRVLLKPLPGTATVEDIVEIHARTRRLCELVDGTLVEKGMGFRQSRPGHGRRWDGAAICRPGANSGCRIRLLGAHPRWPCAG